MTTRINDGLWAWKQPENNNRMIALQEGSPVEGRREGIELAYFGGSAFRITSPSGLTIMIDPWRNPPWGNWDWYLYDFPDTKVDIGVSTHAHFDHDGLHAREREHAARSPGRHVLIRGREDQRLRRQARVGQQPQRLRLGWMTRKLTRMVTDPPDNWRSFDNSLVLVEAAGLKILHWGDNRPNPPQRVWDAIGPGRHRSPAHRRLPARLELRANRDRDRAPAGAHRRPAPLSHLGCDDARLDAAAGRRMGEDARRTPSGSAKAQSLCFLRM